jgi:hypothetical protein
MVHFPKRDLSEASLALERGYHLTKLLARLSVYLADEASSQHRFQIVLFDTPEHWF